MRPLSSRTACRILIAANAILLVTLTFQIGERFLYETSGAFNGDSPIYWAVGRGLVNGLTLYADLFDIKPPGIFLVSAISYVVTGTMRLGHIFQGLAIALLPLTMLVPVLIMQRKNDVQTQLLGLLFGLAFTGVVTMYVALHGGEFQTESFGVLFVCAYTGTALLLRDRHSHLLTLLAGFFFFGGILFKEPFLIVAVISGLLLCRSLRDIVRIVIIPCVIGLVMLGLTFVFMGALDDYLTIYLPFMTGDRTHRFGSPFSRAMLIEGMIVSVWRFSPFLALGLGLLWFWSLAKRTNANVRSPHSLMVLTAFIIGLLMLNYGLQSIRLYSWTTHKWYMRQSPAWIITGLILTTYAWRTLYRHSGNSRRMIAETSLWILAVVTMGYVTGLSGEFLGHHMLFAVPIYMALALGFIETMTSLEKPLTRFPLVLSLLLIFGVFFHEVTDYEKKTRAWMAEAASDQALAEYIDSVMDACDIRQYLIVGETGTNVFGYTKHSPLGPIFFQQTLIGAYPRFTLAYTDQLSKAEMIVSSRTSDRESLEGIAAYVRHDFTETPPACAPKTEDPTGRMKILFRAKHSIIDLNVTADGKASIAFTPEPAVESE